MPRIGEKITNTASEKLVYKESELIAIGIEIERAGGEDKFLITKGAMRYDDKSRRVVIPIYDETGKLLFDSLRDKMSQFNAYKAKNLKPEEEIELLNMVRKLKNSFIFKEDG